MTTWNDLEAQENFTQLLQACRTEPQVLCKHNQPVAVVVDIHLFDALMAAKAQAPSIAELLVELDAIHKEKT